MRWRYKLLMVLSGFGLAHMQNTTDLSPNCGLHLTPLRGAGERTRLCLYYSGSVTMKLLSVLIFFLISSSSAFAVSFDCSKASTFVEKEICSDPLLGKLDDALSENYKGMLEADFGGSKNSLKSEQRKWLANRNKCINNKCLIDAYRKRVDETCEYGVVSGVHPECTMSDDIK